MMNYKGYIGQVTFDDDADTFHGEVINLRDVITFQGESVHELRQAFVDSVDDYLDFCAERGEEPEQPFSGYLTIQIAPELHRKLYMQAQNLNKNLESWVSELFQTSAEQAVWHL